MAVILIDARVINRSSFEEVSAFKLQLERLLEKGHQVIAFQLENDLQQASFLREECQIPCINYPYIPAVIVIERDMFQFVCQQIPTLDKTGQSYFIEPSSDDESLRFVDFNYDYSTDNKVFTQGIPKNFSSLNDALTSIDNPLWNIHTKKIITFIGMGVSAFIGGLVPLSIPAGLGALFFALGFLALTGIFLGIRQYCCRPSEYDYQSPSNAIAATPRPEPAPVEMQTPAAPTPSSSPLLVDPHYKEARDVLNKMWDNTQYGDVGERNYLICLRFLQVKLDSCSAKEAANLIGSIYNLNRQNLKDVEKFYKLVGLCGVTTFTRTSQEWNQQQWQQTINSQKNQEEKRSSTEEDPFALDISAANFSENGAVVLVANLGDVKLDQHASVPEAIYHGLTGRHFWEITQPQPPRLSPPPSDTPAAERVNSDILDLSSHSM